MLKQTSLLTLLFITGLAPWLNAETPAPPIRVDLNEQGVLFTEGESTILFYQRTPKSFENRYERCHYVHPLYDLDGNVLTEDFPPDHPHHRGIFWAWHQVLLDGKKLGDGWAIRDFSWEVSQAKVVSENDESVTLKTVVLWKSPHWTDKKDQQKPFVREETLIRVYRAADEARKIDFTIHLLALEEGIQIGGSEDKKGYGGFSTRIRLPESIRFVGQQGEVTPDTYSLELGPWIDMSAKFGSSEAISGITILVHDSNPGYPQRWIVRQKGSMQNVAYPGRDPVKLPTDNPLVLRYRLILHRGGAEQKRIERWHTEYCASVEPNAP